MLNHIVIMGRMTRDPELRHTNSDVAVCSFTLACDRNYKTGDGERETDFIDFTAWRGTAEFIHKYFSKGSMAVVEGRLQINSYTDKDGIKRRAATVVVEDIYFGESKRRSEDSDAGYYAPPPPGDEYAPLEDDDAGLPFA